MKVSHKVPISFVNNIYCEWPKPEVARFKECVCATPLIIFRFSITPGACNSNYCETCVCVCVLSSEGICVQMIPSQNESY